MLHLGGRLHKSTYVVLLLAAVVLVLANVAPAQFEFVSPSDYRSIGERFRSSGYSIVIGHGWPVAYLYRDPNPDSPWSLTTGVSRFHALRLAVDLLVAALILILAAAAWERRCRRSRHWWNISLREAFAAITLFAIGLAWLTAQRRAAQADAEFVASHDMQSQVYVVGPGRWRSLFGERFLRVVHLNVTEYADRISSTLKGIDRLDQLQDVQLTCHLSKSYPRRRTEQLGLVLADLLQLPKVHALSLSGQGADDSVIAQLGRFPALRCLKLANTGMTPRGIALLEKLRDLEALTLNEIDLHGADLSWIAQLHRLEELTLMDTSVSDQELGFLAQMPTLRSLTLVTTRTDKKEEEEEEAQLFESLPTMSEVDRSETTFGDKTIEQIATLTSLEHLSVTGGLITDEALPRLGKLRGLQLLMIRGPFTDAGVKHIEQLSKVRQLHLESPSLTSAVLPSIVRLQNLEILMLHCTQIEPDTLAQLRALKHLWWLGIHDRRLTANQRSSLEAALPGVMITATQR